MGLLKSRFGAGRIHNDGLQAKCMIYAADPVVYRADPIPHGHRPSCHLIFNASFRSGFRGPGWRRRRERVPRRMPELAACLEFTMNRHSQMKASRGFTVPELLAVIAVILIVLSILLPNLGSARENARKAICASNLHQQGIAMRGYLIDNSYYPGHCGRASNGQVVAIWPTRMRRYAPNLNVFNDPSAPEGFKWVDDFGTGGNYATAADVAEWDYKLGERLLQVHTVPFTYGYNDWGRWNILKNPQRGLGADIRWGGLAVPELHKYKVVAPSNMIAISGNTNDGSWDYNIDPTNPIEYPGKLHFAGENVLFVDAHVDYYKQVDLVNVNNSTAEGKEMSRKWNNHNRETSDQN